MRYQNPQILYFLFAIAIPIIIHFFNLRKHKIVYFSNVRFLQEIKSEKKKKNRLKQILILISRILAISAIIFAFANPYTLSKEDKSIKNNTFIYIDNSFSMDNVSEQGRLLDAAKEKSIEIINNTNPTNTFWIITNNFNSKENLPKNQQEAEKYILSIESSPIIRTTKDILEKQKSLTPKNVSVFIISDFQKSSTDISILNTLDSSQNFILLPLQKQSNQNISIDSCWMEDPVNQIGRKMSVKTKLTNHSSEEITDIIVSLEINKSNKTQQNISLLSNQSKEVELFFSIGESKLNDGIISIDNHPITFDNKFYFSFKIEDKINVCQIYENNQNKNINKVFESEDIMQYTKLYINQMDYNKIQDQELIIINALNRFSSGLINTISDYLIDGGSICIIPVREADINNYNSFLSKINTDIIIKENINNIKISNMNRKHSIFNNVFNSNKLNNDIDLPSINYYYTLRNNHKSIKQNIFRAETGDAFLNYYETGTGEIYLFTSPLSEENNSFCKHALFVTSFFNMALNSVKAEELYYTIFQNQEIKLPKLNKLKQNIFHLKSDEIDVITDYISKNNSRYLLTHNQITKAGHYNLLQEDKLLNTIAFNYSRNESNTQQYSISEIEKFIHSNNITNIDLFNLNTSIEINIEKLNNKKEYWRALILLSLVFILIEILLIKIIKT